MYAHERVTTCPTCNARMPDDPGALYHRASCKREALIRKLREAEARGFEPGEEARLREQIHDAGYVGD